MHPLRGTRTPLLLRLLNLLLSLLLQGSMLRCRRPILLLLLPLQMLQLLVLLLLDVWRWLQWLLLLWLLRLSLLRSPLRLESGGRGRSQLLLLLRLGLMLRHSAPYELVLLLRRQTALSR